jgi:hypothetical protein
MDKGEQADVLNYVCFSDNLTYFCVYISIVHTYSYFFGPKLYYPHGEIYILETWNRKYGSSLNKTWLRKDVYLVVAYNMVHNIHRRQIHSQLIL